MIDSHYIIKAVIFIQTTYSPTAHTKKSIMWSFFKKWLCMNTFKTAISHTAWTFLW